MRTKYSLIQPNYSLATFHKYLFFFLFLRIQMHHKEHCTENTKSPFIIEDMLPKLKGIMPFNCNSRL